MRMMIVVFALSALALELPAAFGEVSIRMTVDADYPGGNVVVERVEADTVYLRPDLRDTEGWWFYWNFRVRGAEGRTLRFQFSGNNPIGVRGPAVSLNRGRTWAWLGADAVSNAFSMFSQDAAEVRSALRCPTSRPIDGVSGRLCEPSPSLTSCARRDRGGRSMDSCRPSGRRPRFASC